MALLITWPDVVAIASSIEEELNALPVETQTMILNMACCHVNADYGCYTAIMQAYWAAHVAATTFVLPAGEGAETTENIGSVSASRNQPVNNPQANEAHLETVYGRMYQYYKDEFKRNNVVAFGNVSCGVVTGFSRTTPSCS
jgi:hypothetical protein